MAKWSKIAKGDRVELRGREYEVVKIKPKGKALKVTVRGSGSVFESKVDPDAKVKRVPDPLHDETGAQRRWAKPREVKHAKGIPAGDSSVTAPPRPPSADPWETKRDKTERLLERALGAVLMGEATDEGVGYYVPPVDVTTVAAHLVTFHGEQRSDWDDDEREGALLKRHDVLHAQHLDDPAGSPLKVNHWHTETRP